MYAEKSAAENLWFTNILKAFVKDSVDGICWPIIHFILSSCLEKNVYKANN